MCRFGVWLEGKWLKNNGNVIVLIAYIFVGVYLIELCRLYIKEM